MKRISNFEECRMDMKKMAVLHGGAGTTGSQIMGKTQDGCGDSTVMTWDDGYRSVNGKQVYYEDNHECKQVPWDCPGVGIAYELTGSSMLTSSFAGTVNNIGTSIV